MSTVWRKVARALLKLVGRSPSTNVVSGDRISSDLQEATASNSNLCLHNDDVENQIQESSARGSPSVPIDHRLHKTRVQQSPGGGHDARRPNSFCSTYPTNTPSFNALEGNSFAVPRQHRRVSSTGSEISLTSAVSTTGATTGAYTGFTQHGQYDLTQDVILRGEFISDQQAKVTLNLHAMCCFAVCAVVKLTFVLQAVIVCIRIATYIGVTILVVALTYKLKKVCLSYKLNKTLKMIPFPLLMGAVPHGQQSPDSLHRVFHCSCTITSSLKIVCPV